MTHLAFIALGSNLQNPTQQVQMAMRKIADLPQTELLHRSSCYQTAPIDCPIMHDAPVPDFINAVVQVRTSLSPQILLKALHGIEDQAGRERPYLNAPRVLDCDLLLYDDLVIDSDTLSLPHPRMHKRGFVLLPLFEIAPNLSIPIHGKIASLITPELKKNITKITDSNIINQ